MFADELVGNTVKPEVNDSNWPSDSLGCTNFAQYFSRFYTVWSTPENNTSTKRTKLDHAHALRGLCAHQGLQAASGPLLPCGCSSSCQLVAGVGEACGNESVEHLSTCSLDEAAPLGFSANEMAFADTRTCHISRATMLPVGWSDCSGSTELHTNCSDVISFPIWVQCWCFLTANYGCGFSDTPLSVCSTVLFPRASPTTATAHRPESPDSIPRVSRSP